jgi:hypothetical protein
MAELSAALGTQMPALPLSSGLLSKATGPKPQQITAGEMFPAMQERRGKELELRQGIADTEAQIAGAEQEQKVAGLEQRQQLQEQQAAELRQLPEREQLRTARQELAGAAFVPTKETAQDIATIFSLTSIIGMAIGGGAKQNAYAAMAAMNGMLDGYQKGRADIYKRERDMFDKNLKALQTKVQTLQQELTEAIQLKQQDFKAGETAIEVALAKAGADLIDLKRKKSGDLLALDIVVGLGKDTDNLIKMTNEQAKQAEEMAFKERQLAEQSRQREEDRALRLQMAELKAGGGAGKPLPAKEVSAVEGLSSLSDSLKKLEQDFKPEFASMGVLGFGADLQLEATRRLGGKKAQDAISWWSRYNRLQAPNRHALFGATLTGNELKNYQSFTAKPSDSAETVKTMLRDQADYSDATARQKAMQYESAGYRVPQLRQINFEQTYSGGGQTPAAQPQQGGSRYQMGQVITKGNKQYRVVGLSNPDDPDVEEVK